MAKKGLEAVIEQKPIVDDGFGFAHYENKPKFKQTFDDTVQFLTKAGIKCSYERRKQTYITKDLNALLFVSSDGEISDPDGAYYVLFTPTEQGMRMNYGIRVASSPKEFAENSSLLQILTEIANSLGWNFGFYGTSTDKKKKDYVGVLTANLTPENRSNVAEYMKAIHGFASLYFGFDIKHTILQQGSESSILPVDMFRAKPMPNEFASTFLYQLDENARKSAEQITGLEDKTGKIGFRYYPPTNYEKFMTFSAGKHGSLNVQYIIELAGDQDNALLNNEALIEATKRIAKKYKWHVDVRVAEQDKGQRTYYLVVSMNVKKTNLRANAQALGTLGNFINVYLPDNATANPKSPILINRRLYEMQQIMKL